MGEVQVPTEPPPVKDAHSPLLRASQQAREAESVVSFVPNHLWPDYLPSQANLLSVSYRTPLPRQGPGGMTSLGTFCLDHLPIWTLSAYFLGLGQAVDKGIPTLDNQPSTENTPLS